MSSPSTRSGPPAEHDEYLLGTDAEELDRLRFQHQVWSRAGHELFERAGLSAGEVVLDLGCGPGFTSVDLAHVVGREGRVIARDQSELYLAFLRRECSRIGLTQVETSAGPVEELSLPAASLDAAYSRWLFCWLAEPAAVLARVARALKEGGRLMLQEYLDWGALRLLPEAPACARAVAACMQSWPAGNATIDFAAEVPRLAPRSGLVVEHFRARARVGRPGSPEWGWVERFFRNYLPRLVERGLFTPAEVDAWRREWSERAADPASVLVTPTMADVILRKV